MRQTVGACGICVEHRDYLGIFQVSIRNSTLPEECRPFFELMQMAKLVPRD